MQIDLYQTLKSINVSDDQAKLVVNSIEEYIDSMIGDATKPLQEKLEANKVEMNARFDTLQRSIDGPQKYQSWVISIIGLAILAMTAIGVVFRH